MKLGKKILELRKKKGLSQEQLGEKVDVTRQTISNWELEETSPNPEQLKLLSKALNVSVDDLIDNDLQNVVLSKIKMTERQTRTIKKILKGFLIGFIGHCLKDAIFYGSPWFSWVIASAVVGLVIGLASKKINISGGEFNKKDIILFNITQVIANALAWFVVAPTLDIWIYAEPASKVYIQGALGGTGNMITVAILGTAILKSYAKTKIQTGSLDREL